MWTKIESAICFVGKTLAVIIGVGLLTLNGWDAWASHVPLCEEAPMRAVYEEIAREQSDQEARLFFDQIAATPNMVKLTQKATGESCAFPKSHLDWS